MKTKFYPVILVIVALITFSTQKAVSQDRINWDKVLKDWSASVHGGATMPYTDVRSYDFFRKTKPVSEYQWGVGGSLTKMMGGIFGIQARYTYGRLQGYANLNSEFKEDLEFWRLAEFYNDFYFKTDYHQPSINLYMNFSNMFMGLNRKIRADIKEKAMKERKVSAYGRAGIGAIWFDSQLYNADTDAKLTAADVKDYGYGRGFSGNAVELAFPFALGLKFKVNKLIDINVESEFILVHDDKLDALIIEDVTKDDYILDALNNLDIKSNTVRNSMGGRYDKFMYVNAGINFKFGTLKSQDEHIEWVNPLEAYMDDNDAKVQYLLDNMYEVKDEDNDGVIDELDLEPGTAEGAYVDTHGRTLDSDKDGIPDHEDPEPFSTPGLEIVDGKNVYPETWTPQQIKDYVANNAPKSIGWSLSVINFDLDQAKIKTEMVDELYKVAAAMRKYPDLKVNVKGHTDIRYTDAYNQKLSEQRTQATIDYMVNTFGIAKDRFVPGSFGKSDLLIPNAKKEAEHMLNRRVELTPANY